MPSACFSACLPQVSISNIPELYPIASHWLWKTIELSICIPNEEENQHFYYHCNESSEYRSERGSIRPVFKIDQCSDP